MLKRLIIFCMLLITAISFTACASINAIMPETQKQQTESRQSSHTTSERQTGSMTEAGHKIETETKAEAIDKHICCTSPDIPLSEIMRNNNIEAFENINLIVELGSRTLSIRNGETVLKQYRIAAGTKTDDGDKEKEGDYRTPRGNFYICNKEIYDPPRGYLGSRWMLLSYPGTEAAEIGFQNGAISKAVLKKITDAISSKNIPPQNTILGSAIGIHGGARKDLPKDWTAGCIGMYNEDVEEIFEYVGKGTPVIIAD